MIRRVHAALAALGAAALVAGGAVVATAPALAANGADFEAGYIVSDEQFYNGDALNAQQVQDFLNDKGSGCTTNCLKNYTMNTPSMPETPRCKAYQGEQGESAAQIISKIGLACNVSPKALLVILEKETSLVTLDYPADWRYDRAMGYYCPDDPARPGWCAPEYAGLFNQLYNAAAQYQRYAQSPNSWNYVAGRTNRIQYNVPLTCGTKEVYIKNQATAGLYIYTPYTPNQAALDNLYGTGDNCSTYGNRNFWRLWSDWFGSPTAPVEDEAAKAAAEKKAAEEAAAKKAAEEAAAKKAAEEKAAQEAAEKKAAEEKAAKEAAEKKAAEEKAAKEAAEKKAAEEKAAKEAAEKKAAEEKAAKEAAEKKAAEDQAAKEAAQKQAAQEAADKAALEQAKKDAAKKDAAPAPAVKDAAPQEAPKRVSNEVVVIEQVPAASQDAQQDAQDANAEALAAPQQPKQKASDTNPEQFSRARGDVSLNSAPQPAPGQPSTATTQKGAAASSPRAQAATPTPTREQPQPTRVTPTPVPTPTSQALTVIPQASDDGQANLRQAAGNATLLANTGEPLNALPILLIVGVGAAAAVGLILVAHRYRVRRAV